MSRYWPLTAVLLAFWMGREIGAQGNVAAKVTTFETIHAKKIVVEGKNRVVIDEDGILVQDFPKVRNRVLVKPGSISLLCDQITVASLEYEPQVDSALLTIKGAGVGARTFVSKSMIVIQDPQGRKRFGVANRGKSTELGIYDATGTLRAGITQGPDVTGIFVKRENGRDGAGLTAGGVGHTAR